MGYHNGILHSGKHRKNYMDHHRLKSVNQRTRWAIFNSKLLVYQRLIHQKWGIDFLTKTTIVVI